MGKTKSNQQMLKIAPKWVCFNANTAKKPNERTNKWKWINPLRKQLKFSDITIEWQWPNIWMRKKRKFSAQISMQADTSCNFIFFTSPQFARKTLFVIFSTVSSLSLCAQKVDFFKIHFIMRSFTRPSILFYFFSVRSYFFLADFVSHAHKPSWCEIPKVQ